MEELTESARQCLVSQGIIIGTLSVLNSLGLFLTGIVVITRANDILHFTSLTHLAILEIVCGGMSLLAVAYIWWIVAAYRNRQLEVRSKYLDEHMSRGLIAAMLPVVVTFSAVVVNAVFMMIKIESSSTYEVKSAMSMYPTDITKKIIVDQLQMVLECCGSQSLLDWFLIDWQNADMEPKEHIVNGTFSDWDSVPFSCCCIEAPPPCIHHQLRAFGVGSLYTAGCADKLDEAVFYFVILLMYTSRKLQTSARSAINKGDATAPGTWWILSPAGSNVTNVTNITNTTDDTTPLLEDRSRGREFRFNDESISMADHWCKTNKVIMSPVLVTHKTKKLESTVNDDWETLKTRSKHLDGDSSEDWTRRAYNPSGSTSTTSFLSTSLPINQTAESRHSASDTAVANLEVSRHFEHKVRPLYRS